MDHGLSPDVCLIRVTRRMSLAIVQHEWFTLPEYMYLNSHWFLCRVSRCRCNVLSTIICPFVLLSFYLVAIDLRLPNTPLVSSNINTLYINCYYYFLKLYNYVLTASYIIQDFRHIRVVYVYGSQWWLNSNVPLQLKIY